MNASRILDGLRHATQKRAVGDLVLQCLPLLALLAVASGKLAGSIAAATVVAMAGLLLLAGAAWRRTRQFNASWLAQQLDAERKDFDDSADLLFADETRLGPLQRLQRERLQQRLQTGKLPDLRPAWSRRAIAIACLAAAIGIPALLFWPKTSTPLPALAPGDEPTPAVPGIPHLAGQALRIEPPAYTRLPVRDERMLDAKAPQGARLHWRLRFEPQPANAELVFVDGQHLPLQRDGDDWTATRALDKSMLYRVAPQGAAKNSRLYRLDAVPDQAPQLKVVAPAQGLTLVQTGQREWSLAFEASDDYGVASTAELRITLAQGSGENIKFSEQSRTLSGSGSTTNKRFATRLDIAALGMAVGDDLVVQLTVRDNRSPSPQSAQGPGLILRWLPPQEELSTGIDGVVQRTLPAYFRSQRQIIIDTETLLKEQRKLSRDQFVERSDRIGIDQRLLRLRYGQFLGEESEGAPTPPKPLLPTNDAEDAPDAPATEEHHDDGHDHGQANTGNDKAFGNAGDVLTEFGHTHDIAEAATLIDPKTRATLKQALDQMWRSELQLRQGEPRQALPFAYNALEFIKQVQQADRIYLARVGTQLPPLDFARRMTGKREGIASRPLPTSTSGNTDDVPARLWLALDPHPGEAVIEVDLASLQGWLRENESRLDDPLSLLAAIETLHAEPDCEPCRDALRSQLWRVLQRPPVQVPRRDAVNETGQRYLDALKAETSR
ncbi:MAG: hypothetical protein QM599_00330 [Pseudoxanthomonas sp.]